MERDIKVKEERVSPAPSPKREDANHTGARKCKYHGAEYDSFGAYDTAKDRVCIKDPKWRVEGLGQGGVMLLAPTGYDSIQEALEHLGGITPMYITGLPWDTTEAQITEDLCSFDYKVPAPTWGPGNMVHVRL